MSGTYNQSFDAISPSEETELLGGTDQTKIGNVGDRLKVDASFTSVPSTKPQYPGVYARFVDMNASSGGVARDTGITSTSAYTTVFLYSGSGTVFSFLINLEGNLTGADAWNIKFEIDSQIVGEFLTTDIGTASLYNLLTTDDEDTMGVSLVSNVLRFASPRTGGLSYSSSVKISVKKATSTSSKKFRAGLIYMTKET